MGRRVVLQWAQIQDKRSTSADEQTSGSVATYSLAERGRTRDCGSGRFATTGGEWR